MKVRISKDKCVMCGSCVGICPEVFEMKDDGVVDVKDAYKDQEVTDGVLQDKVKQAMEACPTSAIEIEE